MGKIGLGQSTEDWHNFVSKALKQQTGYLGGEFGPRAGAGGRLSPVQEHPRTKWRWGWAVNSPGGSDTCREPRWKETLIGEENPVQTLVFHFTS